jgi:hypothetical protein
MMTGMPVWLPWTLLGGIVFIVLSMIGSKLKERPYHKAQYLQDFISGAILIGFVGVAAPELFPAVDMPTLPSALPSFEDEVDIQVGPPRLMR